jgi:plasmid stabilization system protein ParE
VAQVIYSENALENIERAFEFMAESDLQAAAAAISAIRGSIAVLSSHPMIGRSMDGPLRELVISFGKTGYVALYRFRPERDEVRILAIRHQRELDYPI